MKKTCRIAAAILAAVMLLPCFAYAKVDAGTGNSEPKTYTGDYILIMNRYLNALSGNPLSLKGKLSAIETAGEPNAASLLSVENETRPIDLGLWMDDPTDLEYTDTLSLATLADEDETSTETKKPGECEVGDTRDFVTYPNGVTTKPTKVNFTLVYNGVINEGDTKRSCTMWVPTQHAEASVRVYGGADTVTYKEAATQLGQEFDEKIYPYLEKNFGAYDDMNGDGSVTFLLYDIGGSSGGTYTAGFFYGGDMNDLPSWTEGNSTFPGYVGSTNQMDIMHLNISTIPNSGMMRLKKTLAHEFVHLLVYSSYRRMGVSGISNPATYGVLPTWMNEGIAQAAEHNIYGETLTDRIGEYNRYSPLYAHNMLMSYKFEGLTGDETLFRYAQSYLAILYLQSRVAELNGTTGVELYKKIIGSGDLRVINSESEASTANEKLCSVVASALSSGKNLGTTITITLMQDFNIATVLEEPQGRYGFGRFTEALKDIDRKPTDATVLSKLDAGTSSIYSGGTVLIALENGVGQFDLTEFNDGKGTPTLAVRGLERAIDVGAGATLVFDADGVSVNGTKWFYKDCVIRSSKNSVATVSGTLSGNIRLGCDAKVNGELVIDGGSIELIGVGISIPAGGKITSGAAAAEGAQVIKATEATVTRGEESEIELGFTASAVTSSASGFFAQGYPTIADGKLKVKTLSTVVGGQSAVVSVKVLDGLNVPVTITVGKVECEVAVNAPDKVYGEAIEPTVTATDNGAAVDLSDATIKLEYKKDGAKAEPKNAGRYTVTASVDSDEYYGSATAEFEIAKRPLTITDISAVGRKANGSKSVEVRGTLNGVLDADKQSVKLNLSGSMEDANEGEDKPVTVTATLSGSAAGNYYIDGELPTDITVTITEASTTPSVPSGPTVGGSFVGGGSDDEEEPEPSAEPIAVEKDEKSGTVTTRGETSASVDTAAVADAESVPVTKFVLDGATVSAATAEIAGMLGEGDVLTVSVTSEKNADGEILRDISVTLGEDIVSGIPLTVELDARKFGAGSVAYIVSEDGSEQMVMQSCKSGDSFVAELESGVKIVIRDESKAFEDTEKHWGKDSADFATSHGLFVGTSDTEFSPDEPMTRGMITTVLWRLAERPSGGDGTFDDVSADMYYAEPIAWGIENGIVKGVGDGMFAPNDAVDRESVAIMLYRFAQKNGLVSEENAGDLDGFADADSVSPWAQKELAWAVSVGIITGKDGNRLEPTACATRVEVATMMWRYLRFAIASSSR